MSAMIKVEVLRAACCVAGANGDASVAESTILRKLAREAGVGQASLEAMIARGCSDQNFCNEQFRVLKADPKEAMAILLEVAMSDGVIDEQETSILRVLSTKLEVPEEIFDQLMVKASELAGGQQ